MWKPQSDFSIVKCVGKLFVLGRRAHVKTTKKNVSIIVLRHSSESSPM